MKKIPIAIILLAMPLPIFAQFNEGIGTLKDQAAHSVQLTKIDTGFIVAGEDRYSVFGGKEASLIKTTPYGLPQWSMVYGNTGDEFFNSVRELDSVRGSLPVHGYAALGTTTSITPSEDLYFVRTDSVGVPLFSFIFGKKNGNERGHCLQYIRDFATGKYGYVMVGQTNSYTYFGNSTDILLIKTDAYGNLVKAKVIGAQGDDIGYWIEQTKDGGFVVTGSTTTYPGGDNDIFVIRLDKNFDLIWQSIYKHCDVHYEDIGYGIVENPIDGSYTVTGFTKSFGNGYSQDVFLLNLKSTGTVNWMRTYGTKNTEQGASIELSNGGNEYIISGLAIDSVGNENAFVFKTTMTGNPIWSYIYGASTATTGAEITANSKNGYIFTGYAESGFTIDKDYYLVNLSNSGESGGCQTKFTPPSKFQSPCTFSNFQAVNVYDLKFIQTKYKNTSYQIKYCERLASLTSLVEPQGVTADYFVIYPNPSSASVQLIFKDSSIQYAGGMLVIYDHNGKIFYTTEATSEDILIPLDSFPNGIYLVNFTTSDGTVYQKKLIKN